MADVRDEFSPALVAALAAELGRAWPGFPQRRFTRDAGSGLAALALMQRVNHVAGALGRVMPGDFGAAAAVVDRAVDSPTFTGWMTVPCGYWVAACGIDDPHVALPLLARLTPRWSSEGPVCPFLEAHPDITYAYLQAWVADPDEHVRRLVSEGTRPRLPWASRLRALIADPSPAIALLDRLVDDPSEYVRRSVANHLNDIAKDHPDIALDCARRWLAAGDDRTMWVIRHGLRTLVKRGEPDALRLLGFDHATVVRLHSLAVTPARLPIGGHARIDFVLCAEETVRVAIDYLVHHAGAQGVRAPKVFKLTTRTLQPGLPQAITRRHMFRQVSVRRLYPGTHRIEIQVNGQILGGAAIELTDG